MELTLSVERQKQMAYELAQCSQPNRMHYNLNAISKYNGESTPDILMATFVNKTSLCGIIDENMLMRTFLSFITGKALTAQAKL